MAYADLREFLAGLEALGELKRVATPVSPRLEMTELLDRVLRANGPALLFEQPTGHSIPVLGNLFGTVRRVALAMGIAADKDPAPELRRIGPPEPPDHRGALIRAMDPASGSLEPRDL